MTIQSRGSTLPPTPAGAWGGVNQQQQPYGRFDRQSATSTTSPPATQALALYHQCVSAGMWARYCVETTADGEAFELHCGPAWSSTHTPHQKTRRPRHRRRGRRSKRSSAGAAAYANPGVSATPSAAAPATVTPAAVAHLTVEPTAVAQAAVAHPAVEPSAVVKVAAAHSVLEPAAAAPAALSYSVVAQSAAALVAVAPAAEAPTASAPPALAHILNNPVVSPERLGARKKRKAGSPAESFNFVQVDGNNSSPPPSPTTLPPSTLQEELPPPPQISTIPTPPPQSNWFCKNPRLVICNICLNGRLDVRPYNPEKKWLLCTNWNCKGRLYPSI